LSSLIPVSSGRGTGIEAYQNLVRKKQPHAAAKGLKKLMSQIVYACMLVSCLKCRKGETI
jgi:hypothetical protein